MCQSARRPPQISRLGRTLWSTWSQKAMTWASWRCCCRSWWSGFEICWRTKVATKREGNNHERGNVAGKKWIQLKRNSIDKKVGQQQQQRSGKWPVVEMGFLLGPILATVPPNPTQPPILTNCITGQGRENWLILIWEDFTAAPWQRRDCGNMVSFSISQWCDTFSKITLKCLGKAWRCKIEKMLSSTSFLM